MYKALLVDDEPWALIGIRKSFKWEDKGFEVIGEATNPFEALDIIQREKPDIVFTDIRMPGMSGIELMQKVREIPLDTEFVVISGFAEFSYAQEAIRYGALDYCLKPLDIDAAGNLLERLLRRLQAKMSNKQNEFFDSLIENRDNINDLARQLGLSCSHRFYRAYVAIFTNTDVCTSPAFLNRNADTIEIQLGAGKYFYLKNFDSDMNDSFDFKSYPGVSIGASRIADSLDDVLKLYKEADMAANSCFIYKKPGYYEYQRKNIMVVNRLVEDIISAIEAGNDKELACKTENIPEDLKKHKLYLDDLVYLWNQISAFVNKKYWEKAGNVELDFTDYEQILSRFRDINSLCDYLLGELLILIDNASVSQPVYEIANEGFKKLLDYINGHYDEQLFLRELASKYYINQTYCCDLFKKVTGMTFSEYITRLRLSKAKELLKLTELSISDVAQKVGYNDYFYFNKVFKKFYGDTPSKFRKKLIGN